MTCALTRECRGSFVTSQRLLHGHCCPPQMTLAAGGTSVSSAALYGRSVRCNCAWSDTRPRPHYSWTVAAVSQEYWNVRCLLRRYVHMNVNRRRLLGYYDQLRRWMRCSFLRDCGTGLPVCTLRVLVCSGSHRGYQHWQQISARTLALVHHRLSECVGGETSCKTIWHALISFTLLSQHAGNDMASCWDWSQTLPILILTPPMH